MAARIVVAGLGPGDPSLRTVGEQRALDEADRIVLRTRIHPGLDDLADDPRVIDCDDLYDGSATFEEVYLAVAERVVDLAEAADAGTVAFAVPGHPRFGERSVRLLEERAVDRGFTVEVQGAVSALDAIANALSVDPLGDEVQLLDATAFAAAVEREPFAGGLVAIDPQRPCLVGQVYSATIAAAVKLALARFYPDDHPIVVVRAAGVDDEESLDHRFLFELDRRPVDNLSSVWVPALSSLAAYRSPHTLQRIVALLRAPGGCPWDRKQTHSTLRQAVIEEAYETVDAIDAGDAENLAEELGDLLLQAALHAQIAEEDASFALEDVYESVNRKLIRRHPHVFGTVEARTPAEVVTTWEAVKAAERAATAGGEKPTHPLDRLPRSMPELTRATMLLAPRKAESRPMASEDEIAVIGEALLAAVEAAAGRGVDPEGALDEALRRRVDRDVVVDGPAVGAKAAGRERA